MQAAQYDKFRRTGIVPKGFVATAMVTADIQHERLVQSAMAFTGPLVLEGHSVRREETIPIDRWELHPIDNIPIIKVTPSGRTEVRVLDLSRRLQ